MTTVASPRGPGRLVVATVAACCAIGCSVDVGAVSADVEIAAAGQTDAVDGSGDDADDPAIWHHPADPEASLILGTNKGDDGGLHVYDGDGTERQFIQIGALNNVDVRYALDGLGDYAAASNRGVGAISVFAVADGVVELAGSVEVPGEPYGLCLGVLDDVHHAVVTYESGQLRQYVLRATDGAVAASEVRTLDLGRTLEGCVVDDEHGVLYVGDEPDGIYALDLDPESGDEHTVIDRTGDAGNLVADVEGLALYRDEGGGGHLLVSSQGASRIEVYRRGGDHRHLGSFRVVAGGGADEVSATDGIEVSSAPVGRFGGGLVVIHDGENEEADASNFKLVAWDEVAEAMGLSDHLENRASPTTEP